MGRFCIKARGHIKRNSILQLTLAIWPLILLIERSEAICDPTNGPAGFSECRASSFFSSDYQCWTCLSNEFIIAYSQGRDSCADSSYCYYSCSAARQQIANECSCSPGSVNPAVNNLPGNCFIPDGKDCSWFRLCLANQYPCDGQAGYSIGFGERFCTASQSNLPQLTQSGREWMYASGHCQQIQLAQLLHLCSAQAYTCSSITTMISDVYQGCYLSPYNGPSVCDIVLTDFVRIFFQIRSTYAGNYLDALPTLFNAMMGCIESTAVKYSLTTITDLDVAEAIGLEYIMFVREESGRAVNVDNKMIDTAIQYIATNLQWAERYSMNWFAVRNDFQPIAGEIVINLLLVTDYLINGIPTQTNLRLVARLVEELTSRINANLAVSLPEYGLRLQSKSLRICNHLSSAQCSGSYLARVDSTTFTIQNPTPAPPSRTQGPLNPPPSRFPDERSRIRTTPTFNRTSFFPETSRFVTTTKNSNIPSSQTTDRIRRMRTTPPRQGQGTPSFTTFYRQTRSRAANTPTRPQP